MTETIDVAILGGGLAGLTLAHQIKKDRPATSITVLEKLTHPVPEAAFKVGESSVEIGAHYFAEVLGFKDHFEKDQLPKFGLRFFFNRNGTQCISDGLELGLSEFFPKPSYQLDRGRFENHLAKKAVERGIHFLDGVKVHEVNLAEDNQSHTVTYTSNGHKKTIECRWVVDASGRAAILKKKLGLAEPVPHLIHSAWFRVGAEIHIDDWCDTSKWNAKRGSIEDRWLSTNHLMGRGYWVWLIPLASGSTSIGIVADPSIHPLSSYNQFEKAMDFLREHEPQCAAAIEPHIGKIQDFKALKNIPYGCKQVFSADRWALTGEAGVFLDPFYSPGSDFIAISNSFINQLICRELSGKPIKSQVGIYDQLYKSFFQGTLEIYNDQYQLFGNMQLMPLKILWDYAVYWAHPAYLFIHGRMWDLNIFINIRSALQKVTMLNKDMQQFFREWHQKINKPLEQCFLDQAEVRLMYDLNSSLVERIDRETFIKNYAENVAKLERFAHEIQAKIRAYGQKGSESSPTPPVTTDYLETVTPVLLP